MVVRYLEDDTCNCGHVEHHVGYTYGIVSLIAVAEFNRTRIQ